MKRTLMIIGLLLFVTFGIALVQNELNDPVRRCKQVDSFVSQAGSGTIYDQYACPGRMTKYILH